MRFIDVGPLDGGWSVRMYDIRDGVHFGKELGSYRLKFVARQVGIGAAKAIESEFQIRKRNGQIDEKNSYGNDPEEVQG